MRAKQTQRLLQDDDEIQANLGVQGVIIHVFAQNDGVHSLLTRASDARVALMHVHL